MNTASLREFLRPLVGDMKDRATNPEMPRFCSEIGLPPPPEAPSKRARLEGAFDALGDADVPAFAQRLIEQGWLTPPNRNDLQELLWEGVPWPELPKRLRREIARAIDQVGLYRHIRRFDELLGRLFVFEEDFVSAIFGGPETGLRADIQRHVHDNPDWNSERLFEALGAFNISDRRFALLLEGLASADVRIDEDDQLEFIAHMNPVLKTAGVELRETGADGGYPRFELLSLHTSRGRPKNLIFASSVKPDLRFRDAVDNDIEIVTNADRVLVYDRPISGEGLRWKDLQAWWAETNTITEPKLAKASLYRRLLQSLPSTSPPQRTLFEAYHAGFGKQIPNLPALLPEVWLHWDPKTVRQRGADALVSHRMDFLMLTPGGVRIVIEVDGKQHYAIGDRADPELYARLAASDRELKLAKYEVYRFGAAQLLAEHAAREVKEFFEDLFARYGIR